MDSDLYGNWYQNQFYYGEYNDGVHFLKCWPFRGSKDEGVKSTFEKTRVTLETGLNRVVE